MKKSIELELESSVAERAAAGQLMVDSYKWLYATGVAMNGAGLLKVADASSFDFWNSAAGFCFLVGLFACIWVAVLGGQVAVKGHNEANQRIALLVEIDAGTARPDELAEFDQSQRQSDQRPVTRSRTFMFLAFALFVLGLVLATTGKLPAPKSPTIQSSGLTTSTQKQPHASH